MADDRADRPERLGNPTPIGLMGLSLGCAALAPAELGLTDATDPAIWKWMLVTAGVLQIYAGLADLINRNVLGATAFTVYGALWLLSGWQLGIPGNVSDPTVKAYLYIIFLGFTLFMTIGFATVSRVMTVVFLCFVVIFAVEILAAFLPALHGTALVIAGLLHVAAAFLVLWAAAGGVINPLLGRTVFEQGAPPLARLRAQVAARDGDRLPSLVRHRDLRKRLIEHLYGFWETNAWEWIGTDRIASDLKVDTKSIAPDFWYLFQKGYVAVDERYLKEHPDAPKHVRITAAGIDYYRELQLSDVKF